MPGEAESSVGHGLPVRAGLGVLGAFLILAGIVLAVLPVGTSEAAGLLKQPPSIRGLASFQRVSFSCGSLAAPRRYAEAATRGPRNTANGFKNFDCDNARHRRALPIYYLVVAGLVAAAGWMGGTNPARIGFAFGSVVTLAVFAAYFLTIMGRH